MSKYRTGFLSNSVLYLSRTGAYNRTSRTAARPAKFYLARPLPAAGVEEGARVDKVARVDEGDLFYTGTPGV